MRAVLLNKYNNLLRTCGIENHQSEGVPDIIYIIKKYSDLFTGMSKWRNWGSRKAY